VIHTVDRAQIAGTRTEQSSGILKKENNISVKEIISNDPLDIFENQINNSKSDIESSQIEINSYNQSENQFSDTTNRLISESYNDLITDIYKKALLLLSINNKDIPIELTLYDKNDKLTQNFVDLFKYYIGSSVFKFDSTNNVLYMGDYLNNNGTANYNASRNMIDVNTLDIKASNFIPAYSVSMICTTNNNNKYIGSQFIINLSDIHTNASTFLPIGKCNINQSDINFIINSYNNNRKTTNNNKSFIKNISDLSITTNIYQYQESELELESEQGLEFTSIQSGDEQILQQFDNNYHAFDNNYLE